MICISYFLSYSNNVGTPINQGIACTYAGEPQAGTWAQLLAA